MTNKGTKTLESQATCQAIGNGVLPGGVEGALLEERRSVADFLCLWAPLICSLEEEDPPDSPDCWRCLCAEVVSVTIVHPRVRFSSSNDCK